MAIQTVARYSVRVRDTSLNLIGEVDGFNKFALALRHNGVSDWALEVDSSHPMAGYLATRGNGIVITRYAIAPNTGAIVNTTVPLSGPIRSWSYSKQGRTLTVTGHSDMAYLAMRDAWPVVNNPLTTYLTSLPGALRAYVCGDSAGPNLIDSKSGVTGTAIASPTYGSTRLADDPATSISLNGTSQYFTLPTTSLPTGNGQWAIAALFQPSTTSPGAAGVILNIGNAPTAGAGVFIAQHAGGGFYGSAWAADTATVGSSTAGTTYLVSMDYDGTRYHLYINGVELASNTDGTLALTAGRPSIGAAWNGSAYAFFAGGKIMAAFVGNQFLSASNWAQFYAVAMSRFAYQAYDVRSGVAETIIKQYVSNNVGSGAVAYDPKGLSRVNPKISVAADSARGTTVSYSARFDNLVDKNNGGLLQQLGQAGGVGYTVTQTGNSLVFDCFTPNDKSAAVIFSDALGNLVDYSFTLTAPDIFTGGNTAVAGGSGSGTGRAFAEVADSTSTANWGRAEAFVDSRNTSDPTQLAQAASNLLSQYNETTNFTAVVAPVQSMQYTIDYGLGDKVTVIDARGNAFVDLIREIDINYDSQSGESVTPVIGTPNAQFVATALQTYSQQIKLQQAKAANLERAQ